MYLKVAAAQLMLSSIVRGQFPFSFQTESPSPNPSSYPTPNEPPKSPTDSPYPTQSPSNENPPASNVPSASNFPSASNLPSRSPSHSPTHSPSSAPTQQIPSSSPSHAPTATPSSVPTQSPSESRCLTPFPTPSPIPMQSVTHLLVNYLNKQGRSFISEIMDSFGFNSSKIVDVIYEIGENLDNFDFSQYSSAEKIASITVSSDVAETITERLLGNGDIASVDLDLRRVAPPDVDAECPINMTATTVGRRRNLQNYLPPGIQTVQANELWATPFVEKIGICVVDTGYDLGHIDLPSRDVSGSTPQPGYGDWSVDQHSHGTHCAGTIGAITNNGIGVDSCMGSEENFYFHIGKGLNGAGQGTSATIMAAIRGCQNAGAKIISLSLGGPSSNLVEEAFYSSKFDEGLLLVAAAGNGGSTAKSFPASYGGVMSVAAVEPEATFSQVNNQVEISAPGVSILSTYPGDFYQRKTGTSMSTPHVAGVAALIWSRFPECTNLQIRNILVMTAQKVGVAYSRRYGYGLVQALAAYNLLKDVGCEAGDSFDNPLIDPSKCNCCECVRTASCVPDPHFYAWDNSYYDFQGGCDMIAIDNDKLQLQIRTRPRNSWSTITEVGLLMKVSGQKFRYSVGDTSAESDIDETTSNVRVDVLSPTSYTITFLNALDSFIRINNYGGNINLQVQGMGTIFSGSEGMLGSWDYGGVRFRNGMQFDTRGGWSGTRERSHALALDWKVPSATASLLKVHSDVCVDQRVCGIGTFDCGDIRRLSEALPDCDATCDDTLDLDPTGITKSACEEDILITGENSFTCQPAYQLPIVIEADPESFSKFSSSPSVAPSISLFPSEPPSSVDTSFCENEASGQCIDNGCANSQSPLPSYCDSKCTCLTWCFSDRTSVELENGKIISMNQLRLGDKVLVSPYGKYEAIYGFGHFDATSKVEFLQIRTTKKSDEALEITPNHLVLLEGKRAIPAAHLSAGDNLLLGSTGNMETIVSIKNITRIGAFAPYTPSGKIMTNGVQASCFASLDDNTHGKVSLGGYETPITYHQLGLVFESPRRLMCHHLNIFDCSRFETYINGGLSKWVAVPLQGFLWLKRQHVVIGGTIFMLALSSFAMINAVEMAVIYPALTTLALIILMTVVVLFKTKKNMRFKIKPVACLIKKKTE